MTEIRGEQEFYEEGYKEGYKDGSENSTTSMVILVDVSTVGGSALEERQEGHLAYLIQNWLDERGVDSLDEALGDLAGIHSARVLKEVRP